MAGRQAAEIRSSQISQGLNSRLQALLSVSPKPRQNWPPPKNAENWTIVVPTRSQTTPKDLSSNDSLISHILSQQVLCGVGDRIRQLFQPAIRTQLQLYSSQGAIEDRKKNLSHKHVPQTSQPVKHACINTSECECVCRYVCLSVCRFVGAKSSSSNSNKPVSLYWI